MAPEYADQTVEPVCYDAVGSATTLLARFYREELRAADVAEEEIKKRIGAGYKAGKFKAPRKPGLVYMLSTQNKVFNPFTKKIVAAPPHLMFYAHMPSKRIWENSRACNTRLSCGKVNPTRSSLRSTQRKKPCRSTRLILRERTSS